MTVRAWWIGAGVATLLAACEQPCPDGQERGDDGACAEPDTDFIPETDTDTDPPEPQFATLVLNWEVEFLPNDNELEVRCDGRRVYSQNEFNSRRAYVVELPDLPVGQPCTVTFRDARGGMIPKGNLLNCSTEVASWEAERSYERTVAEVTVVACVPGCADPIAENYEPGANEDDGSCRYILGCTDARALNYDANATKNDGTCDFGGFGVVDLTVISDGFPADTEVFVRCAGFDALSVSSLPGANQAYYYRTLIDSGFDCEVIIGDRTGDAGASGRVSVCGEEVASWNGLQINPGSGQLGAYQVAVASFFMPACSGCNNPLASNFDPDARVDDGSCVFTTP